MNILTKIEETLLILTEIENNIGLLLNLFPVTEKNKTKALDDFKFLFHLLLIIQFCKFYDEVEFHLRKQLKDRDVEILKILKHLYNPVKTRVENGLRQFRNKHVAHNNRDRDGNFVPACKTITDFQIPTNYGEFLFLSYCVINYIIKLKKIFNSDFNSAREKYKRIFQKDIQMMDDFQTEIKSINDVKSKLQPILTRVDKELLERSKAKSRRIN